MSLLRAFSSLGCPNATLEQALALAERFELGGIELRALGGTVDLPRYLTEKHGSPALLAEKLTRRSPVRLLALDASFHVVGGTTAERDSLLEMVPWAEALGIKWLRVFDGGKNADEAERVEAATTMRWWNELRKERSWKVNWMVETHDSLFTSKAIQRFLQAAPGTAMLWDSHHTWKRGGEEPTTTWKEIRESVVHVHVKDSISVPSARHPFTYVLPGDGEFPAAPLMSALRAAQFAGPVSLEWEHMWHPYLPPLENALQAMQDRRWW